MSSPARQMNSRRLPPLPGKGGKKVGRSRLPVSSQQPKSYHKVPDMIITGYSPIPSAHTENQSPFFNQGSSWSIHDLNRDALFHYLNQNPEVLNSYVLSQVSEERIEKWYLVKKSKHTHHIIESSTESFRINGDSYHPSENFNHISKCKSQIQSTKGKVAKVLSKDISHPNGRHIALTELANCVVKAVHADGSNLHCVDSTTQELILIESGKPVNNKREKISEKKTLATEVAFKKETIRVKDVVLDERLPYGLGSTSNDSYSMLALPIMDEGSNVLGVLEIFRNSKHGQFTEGEEEVVSSLLLWSDLMIDYSEITGTILAWGGLLLQYAEIHSIMTKQRKLHEFLLTVTKCIFQDIVSMDGVIMKIMNYAQKLVSADRASLFLVDSQRHELYARIFDIGNGTSPSSNVQQREIRSGR
ncbi:hypothetical protein LOTGIDRAFT_228056 [Lottia gigantea]|uniref:GAF domain-containing protein n=1 Tax=Lottia gigantea TaxID=225164 RepID=V4BCQ3_LOTGI|nr:hypothetical protein LOTGIDRAFT_228056 [Lottia gigantea]ESP05491.1 hypothetical protein LOTGIDRAFT_228056 [Lottia gigantea]